MSNPIPDPQNPIASLPMQTQFTHRAFCDQAHQMSHEQAIAMVCSLHEELLLERNTYQMMLRSQWGLDRCQFPQISPKASPSPQTPTNNQES